MPTLNDTCEETVGCVSGYSCDFFTSLCRKPNEAEFCLPKDVSTAFGCQDGLQCTNANLLARNTSTTGNILAKFYNLPPNTTVLPNFDILTWYFTTYMLKASLMRETELRISVQCSRGTSDFPSMELG